jgi:GR25 family glycosyltransferase involved in LPS biosynthesis/predicted  nucleic acid-binding Zn-ribbon protein
VQYLGTKVTQPTFLPPLTAWQDHGPFAMWLVRRMKPNRIVELGTHYGYSYFAMCQSVLEGGLSTKCHAVDTWKGDEHAGFYDESVYEIVAQENRKYEKFSQLLRKTFAEALSDIPDGSVDLLHIDGRHFYQDVKEDFESWILKLSPSAVVLFHDTEVRERGFGVCRYWAEICDKRPSLNFRHCHGLGVLFWGEDISAGLKDIAAMCQQASMKSPLIDYFETVGPALSMHRELDRRLEEQRLQLGERDDQTAKQQSQIGARDAKIAEMQSHIGARDAKIAEMQSHIGARDAKIAEMQSHIGARDAKIAEMQSELGARDTKIVEMQSQIGERDAKIAEMQSQIGERDAEMTEMQSQIGARDARVAGMQSQIGELDDHVAKLRHRLTFKSTLPRRLAFHGSGKPRGWLRSLLLRDHHGTPRTLTSRILLRKNHQVRPIFQVWYNRLKRVPTNATQFVDERAIDQPHVLSITKPVKSVHIVTSPHTEFIGAAIKAALSGTRLAVTSDIRMADRFEHDLYIVVAPQMFETMPPAERTIVFQMEQVRASNWADSDYLTRIRNSLAILDYSRDNIGALTERGVPFQQLYYVPIQPFPCRSDPQQERDIDVLFYGAVASERRGRYLNALSERLNIRIETNLFGEEIQSLLDRSKIVVNIHFYENALLETTRLSEALSHGAHVISEEAEDQADWNDDLSMVDFVPRDDVEAFVRRVEERLKTWTTPYHPETRQDVQSMPFYLLRALHGCGALSFDDLVLATKGFSLPGPRMVLGLPEQVARYDFAMSNRLDGAVIFPGLRHASGWKGCALSYKFMARLALEQNFPRLMIYEEDAAFDPDTEDRLTVINDYFDMLGEDWDIFSGLLTDLSNEAKVTNIAQHKSEEMIHLDEVIGMVFGIYNRSALHILANYEIVGNDTAKHTIDRYLGFQALRCVTIRHPVATHCDEFDSTLWPVPNREMNQMISRSLAKLEEKRRKFHHQHNQP